jgi:hypothetical protein
MIFYAFLIMTNIGIFGYEYWIVRMSFGQTILARCVTLVTDVFEAIFFIDSQFLKRISLAIIRKLPVKIVWSWLESGLRLALIGPTVYLVKMIILNIFLLFRSFNINPIKTEKVLFAYCISLVLSFCWGAAFDLFLEDWANKFLCFLRTKLSREKKSQCGKGNELCAKKVNG